MKAILIAVAATIASSAGLAAGTCSIRSSPQPPAVVELYTSEGCSSCPPADRWLSKLNGRSDVLALAFHVNYWDKLGWPDRFATAAHTERQQSLQRASGTSYVYTPQVIVNGRDQRRWADAALPRLPASLLSVALVREGRAVRATVAGTAPGPQLAGYWAVLEDGHSSRVRAGENSGATLLHDHVVALYRPLAAWTPTAGEHSFLLELPEANATARRVAFVVTDAAGTRPLQAVVLGC